MATVMTEVEYFAQYRLATVAPEFGKPIPVSRAPVGGDNHHWVTIPWDQIERNPNDPLQPSTMNRGWTFLFGPVKYAHVTAGCRVYGAQPNCSMHINLYKVRVTNGVEQEIFIPIESWEWSVLPYETSSTHLNGTWQIAGLAEGERLRVMVDYWNAREPDKLTASLTGARVAVSYKREVVDA